MPRPSFDQDRKSFLLALYRQESVGNGALRLKLGWREERYWRVHSVLIEEGRIARGRGRGGSVRRIARK